MASTLTFKLVTVDGTPADPPSLTTVAPKWEPGDMIPLGKRTLRVIGVRNIDTDEPTELIVEDMPVWASSASRLAVLSSHSRVERGRGSPLARTASRAAPFSPPDRSYAEFTAAGGSDFLW
jgi:hypothetical protein